MEWIECFLLFVVKTNYSANYIHFAGIYLLSRPCGIPDGEVEAVFDAEGVGVFPALDRDDRSECNALGSDWWRRVS